jgi:hypothetical protein
MVLKLNLDSIDDYLRFIQIKQLPRFSFQGRTAWFPDEYADRLGLSVRSSTDAEYKPIDGLFDYQRDIAGLAIRRKKFAAFVGCGLGKSLIGLEFARYCRSVLRGRKTLIVTPLMVVDQMIEEAHRFYGDSLPIEQVKAKGIRSWMTTPGDAIGVTNYDALKDDLDQGLLGCLVIDESSSLKDFTSKHAQKIIRLGKGLDWKLCMTGTPAPNDRIEFANHAVFLDAFPTINSFLAKFFINRGQTQERWEMKPHAVGAFYKALSHWSIFMENPATYGWKDNCGTIPPIHVHIHDVDLTEDQQSTFMQHTGMMFATNLGGITTRATVGQLAKGKFKGRKVDTNKPQFIKNLVDSWSHDESTLIWAIYDDEQRIMERTFPDAASIDGQTPHAKRMDLIGQFQRGERKILISKAVVLGYGLNLQIATRHVFSGLQDSYEKFHQCVKRSNRVGSTRDLNVHVPVTDIERPMVATVLEKARRIEEDTRIQERLFKEMGFATA